MKEPKEKDQELERKEKRLYRIRVIAVWIFLVVLWCFLQYFKPAKQLPEKDEVRLEPIGREKSNQNE